MKKRMVLGSLAVLFIFYSCLIHRQGREALAQLAQQNSDSALMDPISIMPGYFPEQGNADSGLAYLLHGDAFSSGIPYKLYKTVIPLRQSSLASITGFNQNTLNDLVVYKNKNGQLTATPGCLHCHAQRFNNELIIGLGNSFSRFEVNTTPYIKMAEQFTHLLYGKNSAAREESEKLFAAGSLLAPKIVTEMQGPSSAHRIAELMAAHRDPQSLVFRPDTSYFFIPPIVIPTDIPPWWASKKKKAFTITAMEQGNLLKHLVSPTILTYTDTTEFKKIYSHSKDLWAYILQLQAPKYPYAIDTTLAMQGKIVFEKNCSHCHGRYGDDAFYPNELVPGYIVGTDSLLWKYYLQYPEYENWFEKGWFANSPQPAFIKPQPGYVAPPLDGVWITAPYFHNGSVPTLEAVLNSSLRPKYWKRKFANPRYNYKKVGWVYKKLSSPGSKQAYNTDIPGYGNYGHYYGDGLTIAERKAVLEYLKTL